MSARAALVVVDGMGFREETRGNAVTPRTMPFFFDLVAQRGHALLAASGRAVGLDAGQAGNSEVGHMTIGAGCTLVSTLGRIRTAAESGAWRAHPLWDELVRRRRLHVVGLASDAGVHGHVSTLVSAARLAAERGVEEIFVHPILDGVDSGAGSALRIVRYLSECLATSPRARLGCVVGRRRACDRSGNLDITRSFVRDLRAARLPPFAWERLEAHLAGANEADFPAHLAPDGMTIASGDAVLLANHRADRTAQLARVLAETHDVYALVALGDGVPVRGVFFPVQPLSRGLAFELQRLGLRSVRIAEQCKFPHVTWFLNGLNAHLGERTVEIPSIAETAIRTNPEMSLRTVVDSSLTALEANDAHAIVVNLANLDQVGHLGDLALAEHAAHGVDEALATLHRACVQHGCPMLVTSDHGNADTMCDAAGRPLGSHSTSPVPLVLLGAADALPLASRSGTLANVAATFLAALGCEPPGWMSPSLIDVRR